MQSFHHITFCCQTCCGEEYSTVGKIEDRIIQISFLADESGDEVFNTNPATSLESLALLTEDEAGEYLLFNWDVLPNL